jgi:hypothetical protein
VVRGLRRGIARLSEEQDGERERKQAVHDSFDGTRDPAGRRGEPLRGARAT